MKPLNPPKPNAYWTNLSFITHRKMAVGWKWQKLNSAFLAGNVWIGALEIRNY